MVSQVNSVKLSEKITPIILKLFQQYCGGWNTPKLMVRDQQHPDTKPKTAQDKENYRSVSLMNIDTKILNKILATRIQQHIKRITHNDQVEFMQGI